MRMFCADIFYTVCVSCYVVYVAVLIGTSQAVVFSRVLGKTVRKMNSTELSLLQKQYIRVSSGMTDEIQLKANRGTKKGEVRYAEK